MQTFLPVFFEIILGPFLLDIGAVFFLNQVFQVLRYTSILQTAQISKGTGILRLYPQYVNYRYICKCIQMHAFFKYTYSKCVYISGQIIATSHDLTPNGGLVREIPLFQGNLGW